MEILTDHEAIAATGADAITALAGAATEATFYREGLTPDQIAANRRIVAISAPACLAARADLSNRRYRSTWSRNAPWAWDE